MPEIANYVLNKKFEIVEDVNSTFGIGNNSNNKCWLQDIDMDGTPEFIVGGVVDTSGGRMLAEYII